MGFRQQQRIIINLFRMNLIRIKSRNDLRDINPVKLNIILLNIAHLLINLKSLNSLKHCHNFSNNNY